MARFRRRIRGAALRFIRSVLLPVEARSPGLAATPVILLRKFLSDRLDLRLVRLSPSPVHSRGEALLIRAGSEWISAASEVLASPDSVAESTFRTADVRAFRLTDVMTAGTKNESVLTADGTALMNDIEHRYFEARYHKVPRVYRTSRSTVLVEDPSPTETVPTGIYLGSFATENWFHWVTRIIASATLLDSLPREFDTWPILLPDSRFTEQHRTLLDVVVGGRRVVTFPKWDYLGVEDLLWVEPVTRGLNHLRPAGPSVGGFWIERDAFRSLRDLGHRLAGDTTAAPTPRRVLLDRGPDDSRPYNREAVIDLAGGLGFTPVRMDLLPLAEQIATIGSAEFIIGPSGAAWTNAIWMRPGARGLCWIPEHLASTRIWATLARDADASVALHTFPAGGRFFDTPYVLDLAALRADIERLTDSGTQL